MSRLGEVVLVLALEAAGDETWNQQVPTRDTERK